MLDLTANGAARRPDSAELARARRSLAVKLPHGTALTRLVAYAVESARLEPGELERDLANPDPRPWWS